jgi:hypothetical protein
VILTGLGRSQLGKTASVNTLFDVWFLATTLGLSFCAVGLVATCPESQKGYQQQIDAYVKCFDDQRTRSYSSEYDSPYKQLVFQFAFGQNSYEAFSILELGWLGFHVAFCALRELRPGDGDALPPNPQSTSGERSSK